MREPYEKTRLSVTLFRTDDVIATSAASSSSSGIKGEGDGELPVITYGGSVPNSPDVVQTH